MVHRLHVKTTNPTAGILFSRLSGVELHAPIFSDRFDHPRQPLLKALIFALFQNSDYQVLIFRHDLHLLNVHFRKNCNSTHLCLIMVCYHYCINSVRNRHDSPSWWYSHLSQWLIYKRHISNPSHSMIDILCVGIPKKTKPKMMIFSLRDFLVAPLCIFFCLALQESPG